MNRNDLMNFCRYYYLNDLMIRNDWMNQNDQMMSRSDQMNHCCYLSDRMNLCHCHYQTGSMNLSDQKILNARMMSCYHGLCLIHHVMIHCHHSCVMLFHLYGLYVLPLHVA